MISRRLPSAARSFGAALSITVAVALLTGCNTIPEGRTAVDDVTVRGEHELSESKIEAKIATTKTPRFLGLFPGVLYDYSLFDRFVFQRDLARVEALYRSKGFYDAHARAGRVTVRNPKHVRVEIVVSEGEPVTVRRLNLESKDVVPRPIIDAVRAAAVSEIAPGARFDEERLGRAEGSVRRTLRDLGYAYATVDVDAALDIVRRAADITFTVTLGPKCVFGDVTVKGLGELPEGPVRRAVDIDPGDAFAQSSLDDAQQAVLELGVFASVEVKAALPQPPRADHVVPVTVTVEPTRLHTVRLGGGVEFDALKTDLHGVAGWESRNFLGGMRTFSVDFQPGVVLYPIRVNNIEAPEKLMPEERLRVELRQPGFLEARTNGFIRPRFDVYPVLLNPNPPPDQPVLGYAEMHAAAGVDRTMWKFFGALSHNVQVAYPFSYLGPRDPTLGTLVISYPELYATFDFRDDKVHPHSGIWIGNTLQVAGGPFGGDADDVKVQPDLRGYVPLADGVVFAARASVGFLFPQNYGSVVRAPRSTFDSDAATTHDYQLTFFRGFFSGGPSTNRGYPLRGVGPQAIVPFLSPALEAQRLNSSCGDDCRVPTGGFTLWEASAEVRFEITGPLSVATFCDASDVSPRTTDIRLSHPHLSCGGGVRYDTPVGPVRLDLGYRLPGMQVLGGLTPDEKAPRTLPFGIPVAVSLGIGEAY